MKPIIFSIILTMSLLSGCTQADQVNTHPHFKELQNLQTLGAQSQSQQLPILLMFGAQWCEYCELLNETVFEPMGLGGLYEGKVVLMRHVGVDEAAPIPNWEGELINKSKWAYELNADLTPTVLFFDGRGNEVAPRIIGIAEITQYTAVIHRNINIAYRNMGLDKQIPVTPELLQIQADSAIKN